MRKWKNIVQEKVLPLIRKNAFNSYSKFLECKQKLLKKRRNSNNYNNFQIDQISYVEQPNIIYMSKILNKKLQHRRHQQSMIVFKSLKKIKWFEMLLKQTQSQVIKSIIKYCRIISIPKNKVLFRQGSQIKNYYAILKGKIGIFNIQLHSHSHHTPSSKKQKQNQDQISFKRKLKELMFSDIRSPKKKKSRLSNQVFVPHFDQLQKSNQIQQNIRLPQFSKLCYINQTGQMFGNQQNDVYENSHISAMALQQSYLLEINILSFLKSVRLYKQKKIQSQVLFFKKFKCFDLLEQDQLNLLIQTSKIQQKCKNQYVFKTGDEAKQFYLLVQGEVILNKVAKLFRQNPNKLYMSRLESKKDELNILPYANFQTLYNYRPKQQTIQLGIVTKQSIFGEQETFLKEKRQTNAKVSSPTIKYYVIGLQELQDILKQQRYGMEEFKDFLFGTTTKKKILYRQSKFSQVLNFKNKNKLDYFYIEQEQIQSPKKFKLQKINNRVIGYKTLQLKKLTEEDTPPFFTTFNFTKFLDSEKIIDSLKLLNEDQTPYQQRKMLELTHATKVIQHQLNSEQVLYNLRNPQKRLINLTNPLFEASYFSKIHRQNKRLQQQYKKKRFSIRHTSNIKRLN